MRHVVLILFVLAGCSSGVKHDSRQLTCLGFCAETTVKHSSEPAEDKDKDKAERKQGAPK